jgi:hypothetical protein
MEAADAPQPRTVEAMCKANWPTQGRSTDAEQAALKTAATHGLEGAPPREEYIESPRGAGARIEGARDVATHCKDTRPTHSVRSRTPRIWVSTHLLIPGHQRSGRSSRF